MLNFTVPDNFGGRETQAYSYTSFKWVRYDQNETHELVCEVQFSLKPFDKPDFPFCDSL